VDAPLDGPADTDFGRVEVSHVGLNDGVVEGLRCLDVPAFSVQYHPEAAAGPHDAGYLFDRFVDLMHTRTPRADHALPSDQGPLRGLDRTEVHDHGGNDGERGEG
jgi:carbamoyl-phosphate synthase small subunit